MWCMYILSMYVYSKSICECICVFWICSWVAIGWCSASMSQCLVVSENASGGNHAVAQHSTWVSPSLVVDKALRGSTCCVVFQRKIDWGCPEKGGFKNDYVVANRMEYNWRIHDVEPTVIFTCVPSIWILPWPKTSHVTGDTNENGALPGRLGRPCFPGYSQKSHQDLNVNHFCLVISFFVNRQVYLGKHSIYWWLMVIILVIYWWWMVIDNWLVVSNMTIILSISYIMWCHPSRWRTPSFFKMVIAPPTSWVNIPSTSIY